MLQDALFELAEFGRRFEAPLDEPAPPALIHGEGVGVASRLVQRLHEELAGVLALGILGDQCPKVGDHPVVFPTCQLRLRGVPERRGKVPRAVPPQRANCALRIPPAVARARGLTPSTRPSARRRSKRRASTWSASTSSRYPCSSVRSLFALAPSRRRSRETCVRRAAGSWGRQFGPELIDQAIGGDGPAGSTRSIAKQLLRTRNADQLVTVGDFERTEDPVPLHTNTIGR